MPTLNWLIQESNLNNIRLISVGKPYFTRN